MRIAAWLGWTQYDSKKVPGPDRLIEWIESFVANPIGEDEDDEGPLTAEEIEDRRAAIGAKLMRMFKHPEAQQHGDRQAERAAGSE